MRSRTCPYLIAQCRLLAVALCLVALRVSAACPPQDFTPPPRVNSAVIRCVFRSEPRCVIARPEAFEALVKASFVQRRRTIENNLRLRYPDLKHYFKLAGISEVRRAETLTVAEFARLAEVLPAPVDLAKTP